jgi:hypothetical protein
LRRGDLEKTREAADVPDDRLGLDLLLEIGRRVGAQQVTRLRRIEPCHRRQTSEPQDAVQLERRSQLLPRQWMQVSHDGPARQEVCGATPDLACARACHDEACVGRFDERVNLVEQRRYLLNLVDGDGSTSPFDLHLRFHDGTAPDPWHTAKRVPREQIDAPGFRRQESPHQRAFPRLTRTEEEARPSGRSVWILGYIIARS